jgi:fucose 4-O-acetylase-like acetyltransferase
MQYGKDIIFGLLSILMVFSLSLFLNQNLALEYLGKNSLVIFAFQEPIYRAVIYLFSKLLHLDVEIVRTNLFYSFSIGVSTILIITPVIWMYKKQVEPILRRISQ